MKLMTYSFFKPLQMPERRSWDKARDDFNRYYYNLPATILTNRILYPDYNMRFFITSNVVENPLSDIFNCLSFDGMQLYEIQMDYKLTEPAIFRMMPLWEDVEVMHPRDIDSIPLELEYRYVRSFEEKDYDVGTMRTHQNHYGLACRMLAGLSSYKPNSIPQSVKGGSFSEYFGSALDEYGSDQELIVRYFTADPEYTKSNFYDFPCYNCQFYQDFPCVVADNEDIARIQLTELKKQIFQKQEQLGLTSWAGEPVDARGEYTDMLLEFFPEVRAKMSSHLKEFYDVS